MQNMCSLCMKTLVKMDLDTNLRLMHIPAVHFRANQTATELGGVFFLSVESLSSLLCSMWEILKEVKSFRNIHKCILTRVAVWTLVCTGVQLCS